MAIDSVSSALDALVAHLQSVVDTSGLPAAFAALTVRRGWPEHNVELDMSAGSVVAVSAGQPDEERINPYAVGTTPSVSGLTTTYKVANLLIPLQLDVWCPYRSVRDDLVAAVEPAFANQLPASSGLWLVQSDYHSRPLTFTVTSGPRYLDEASQADRGQWRATWALQCRTDKVILAEHAKVVSIDTTLTTTVGDTGNSVSETTNLATILATI